jgi:hypothetical protein
MAEFYRVDIEDYNGEVVASLKNFQYFSCEIQVAQRESFRLQIADDDPAREIIKEDYIARLWYKNTRFGLDWTNVFSGIIKTPSRVWYSNGRKLAIFYGSGPNEIIDKSLIMYSTDSLQGNKDGNALDIMYEMLEENIGSLAREIYGRFVDHIVPVFIEKVGSTDLQYVANVGHKVLILALKDIRDFSHQRGDRLDFATYYEGGYFWRVEVGKIFQDKTLNGFDISTSKNEVGNTPVVLSPLYNNLQSYVGTKSRIAEQNVILGLGQNTGDARERLIVKDEDSISVSPIAQREALLQAQNSLDLEADLLAALKDNVGKMKNSIEPKFSEAFMLFRDLNVGDYFSVIGLDGEVENKQFDELKIVVQQTTGGSTIGQFTMFVENREP